MRTLYASSALALALTIAAPAKASMCSTMSATEPAVIVAGTVTAVRQVASGGTNAGALSMTVIGGRPRAGSNTATIKVERTYKGVVPDVIEVTSELHDGVNLGTSFRVGPVLVGGYRGPEGRLAANACSVLAWSPEHAVPPGTLPASPAEAERMPLLPVLEAVRGRLEPVLVRLRSAPGNLASVREAESLLRLVADRERTVAIWQAAADAGAGASALSGLGTALYDKGDFPGAIKSFEAAAQLGADTKDMLLKARFRSGDAVDIAALDLRGLTAQTLPAQGAYLRGRNLTNAKLGTLDAVGADLREAKADGLVASQAALGQANLAGASLTEARIWQLDLSGARLTGADLSRAQFSNMRAPGADFAHVTGVGWRMGEPKIAGASFKGARLKGADLSYAAGPGASFEGADLTGAKFMKSDLSGMNFAGARLDGASWEDTTFDCKTVFPDGVNPAKLGLSSWDASCPDKPGYAAGSNLPVPSCSPACHQWLKGDARRSIQIRLSGRHSGTFLYSAGKAATPEACPSERKSFFYSAFGGFGNEPLRIRDAMLSEGFCPVVEPIERHGHPLLSLPLEWNATAGDITRIGFMTDEEFAASVMPAVERMVASGDPLRNMAILHIVSSRPSSVRPLMPFVMALLRTAGPSSVDVRGAGGGSNDASTIAKLAESVSGSPEVVRTILDDTDQNPHMTELPGYSAALASIKNPANCELADRIELRQTPWGASDSKDMNWISRTALCVPAYPAPLSRGLKDQRPALISHAIWEWSSTAALASPRPGIPPRPPLPAIEATLEDLYEVMRNNRVPNEFVAVQGFPYSFNRRFSPWREIAKGLTAIGKAEEILNRLRSENADAKLTAALADISPPGQPLRPR